VKVAVAEKLQYILSSKLYDINRIIKKDSKYQKYGDA
jgi:hypothetical protein